MNSTPLFSIILPIYNAAPYLQECIDSLRAQTFEDFEVIALNDGSTDDSLAVYHAASAGDRRFRLFDSHRNYGVSHQRNIGLQETRGTYLLFVDADDYVSSNTLEAIYRVIQEDHSDLIVYGGVCFPNRSWADDEMNTRRVTYKGREQSVHALMNETGARPLMCNKAYRVSLLRENNCTFNESLKIGEDHVFQFVTFPYAEVVSFIPDKLYHYRQDNPHSAVNYFISAEHQAERVFQHSLFVTEIYNQWKQRGILKSQERIDMLGNWMIDYLYDDIMEFASCDLPRCAHVILPLYKTSPLSKSSLTEENQTRLQTLAWLRIRRTLGNIKRRLQSLALST